MAITVNSSDWNVQRASTVRGAGAAAPILPQSFVPEGARTEAFVAEPRPAARGAAAAAPGALDVTTDLAPGEVAVLAVRHPSGALTFHAPRESTSRTRGGPAEVRFIVPIRPTPAGSDASATRGIVSKTVKAVVVKIADRVVDAAVGFVLARLARAFESTVWKQKGLKEGWLKVTKYDPGGRKTPGRNAVVDRPIAAPDSRHVLECGQRLPAARRSRPSSRTWRRSTAIASSPSITSASAARRQRTSRCC